MEFLSFNSRIRSRFVIIASLIFCMSFPAHAATSFSFVDFSIAFVLGLSLPVILISALVRHWVPNPWWYLAGLVMSTLGCLYALAYLTAYQAPTLLSFSIASICFIYLWYFSATAMAYIDRESEYFSHFKLGQVALATVSAAYIAVIWLFPDLDAYVGWLAFGGLVLFVAAVHITMMAKIFPSQVVRLVIQFLSIGAFIGVMFFYLHAQAELVWLVSTFVTSFVIAMINGNWGLIQRTYQILIDKQEVQDNQLTAEQIFSVTHDPATNLPSFQQAIMRYEQLVKQDKHRSYAVIVVRPKNFDYVNRILGHQNSDILLLQLAYCLKREISEEEYLMNFDFADLNARLARLPSLHFMLAIDLNKIDHQPHIVIDEICKRLAKAVPPAMSFKSFSLSFELAFGVAYTGKHGQTFPEVISSAVDASVEAQKRHKQWVLFDDQVALYTEQHLHKMEQLKQDIASDSLIWQLSPQIDFTNYQVKGFTMQVKWRFGGELLELEDFLEIAEQSGEVYSLSKQMIKNAFKVLYELKKLNVYQPIGIRLSSKDLLEPDLADYIEQQIETYSISAKYLMIQMSEPVMQTACERAKSLIDQLKVLEVGICISEFDGSYESLRYIRKLSVDRLNISCKLLCDADADSAEKAIVNSLVSLARTMKLAFCGTHIASKSAKDIFQLMGGQLAEGDGVASAFSVSEVESWLDSWFKQHPSAHTRDSSLDI